jgi:DNA-directed RNA polymerase specialized sigma24 family protein
MEEAQADASTQNRKPAGLTRLLARLDPDPTRAWQRYADLHLRLTKYFEWNRCAGSEDLADEVLDRVAAKPETDEIREIANYALGVARFVYLEVRRKGYNLVPSEDLQCGEAGLPDPGSPLDDLDERIDLERRLDCLRQCLARLMPGDRELAVQYYSADEHKQMVLRKKIAQNARLTLGALRVRMNRLRAQLEPCVRRRLASRRQSFNPVS